MSIYNKLENIRRLSNTSIASIIDVTNLNFKDITNANLEFLHSIQYDEVLNSISLNTGTFDTLNVTNILKIGANNISEFTIDSNGIANGNEIKVKVSEAKRRRFTDFNNWPDVGVPGEIIYTGIQNSKPEFGEDFIAYLDTKGWVSLTQAGNVTSHSLTLDVLSGNPFPYPDPDPNTGIIWLGAPGLETDYDPSISTVYYTDENGKRFDILTDPVWEKLGNDAIFKLSGKVRIGNSTTRGNLQYIDGNQEPGYVLTSDGSGNASWLPSSGGTGNHTGAYFEVTSFTQDINKTITHNLGTNNVIVQLIDLNTNQLTEGLIDAYSVNTFDVTLTQSMTDIKVMVLSVGGSSVGSTYSNSNLMPVDVGGWDAGSSFLNKTMTEMWDGLLYPYQYPVFTSFTIDNFNNIYEVGTVVPAANHLFQWTTSNHISIDPNTVKIEGAGITTMFGLANDGNENAQVSQLTMTTSGHKTWTISALNTLGDSFNRLIQVYWEYRMTWGTFASKILTSGNINSLSSFALTSSKDGVKHFNAASQEYKVFVWPVAFGLANMFDDDDTIFSIPFDNPYIVSYTNTNGTVYDVYVYVSTNKLGGSMNIDVS